MKRGTKRVGTGLVSRSQAIIIAISVILAQFLLISTSARADTEPNNDFPMAEMIVPGTYSGSLGVSPPGDGDDYYSLMTTAPNTWVYVNVTIPAGGPVMNICLTNAAQIWVAYLIYAGPGVHRAYGVFSNPQKVYIWLNKSSGSGSYQMEVFATLTQLDWIPPVIQDIAPGDMSFRSTKTPVISADYFDIDTGIDASSVVLRVDDVDVTSSATVTDSGVTYTATPLTDGIHSVYLKVADNRSNSAVRMWNFTVDTLGPTITDMRPANASSTSSSTPVISANYSDPSGVSLLLVVFVVDGLIQTPNATVTETGISYTPAKPLADGTHCAGLSVQDSVGNAGTISWCFTVSTPTPTPNPGSFIDQYWWGLVLVAAIILAVIAVTLVRARRRKSAEMPSSETMPPQ
jgi:hypothetical protein